MKNLNKLGDYKLSEKEVDRYMSQILKPKLDEEKRARYAAQLSEKYGFERKKTETGKWKLYSLIAILTTLGSLLLFKYLNVENTSKQIDYKAIAMTYDSENPFQSKTLSRSENIGTKSTHLKAYEEFENQNYLVAIETLLSIDNKSKDQLFLIAYAQFKLDKFEEAQESFAKVLSKDQDDNYHSESRFYQVLCLFAQNKGQEGINTIKTFDKKSWEAQKLNEIISKAKS